MRSLLLFVALTLFLPTASWAQSVTGLKVTPPSTPAAEAPQSEPPYDPTRLTDTERGLVRSAVANTRDAYKRSRTSNGIGNVVSGVLIGGIGAYLYLSQDDPTIRLVGIGIGVSAIPQLVAGMWNIFYKTAQEDIAAKILSNDRLVDGGGLLFVEQEARRAKRARYVGGSTSIVAGAATLTTYFLLKDFLLTGPDNILLIFFSVAAGLQVVQGVISLVGKSGAERSYSKLLTEMGRDPLEPPPSEDPNKISKLRLEPSIFAVEGKLAPGLGLSFGF